MISLKIDLCIYLFLHQFYTWPHAFDNPYNVESVCLIFTDKKKMENAYEKLNYVCFGTIFYMGLRLLKLIILKIFLFYKWDIIQLFIKMIPLSLSLVDVVLPEGLMWVSRASLLCWGVEAWPVLLTHRPHIDRRTMVRVHRSILLCRLAQKILFMQATPGLA